MDVSIDCNYYGKLDEKLQGDNVSVYCVNEAFARLLNKYEQVLDVKTQEIIKKAIKTFEEDKNELKKAIKEVNAKLKGIETKIKDKKE